jgi:hypothetical protein
MDQTSSLSTEDITVTAVVGTEGADYTCCNSDPYDACRHYYDTDPTNGEW